MVDHPDADEPSNPDSSVAPVIDANTGLTGIRVRDPIHGETVVFPTPKQVTPTEATTDLFGVPVTSAATLQTATLYTPRLGSVFVRDAQFNMVAQTSHEEGVSLDAPEDYYIIDLPTTEMKVYLSIPAAVTITPHDDHVEIRTDGDIIRLGTRSLHDRPAAEITTPPTVDGLATAISTFGSALKTQSPERSFPTMQGYPPLLEIDETATSVDVPDAIAAAVPETGIELMIPDRLDAVFAAAPLAYYLAATVSTIPTSESPRLQVGDTAFPMNRYGDFATTANRYLQQCVTMDCITRTEGYYAVPLDERQRLEASLETTPDWAELYDAGLEAQVATYLSYDYEAIEPVIPEWRLTADVVPATNHADTIPHIASELAVVRPLEDVQEGVVPHQMSATVTDGGCNVRASGGDESATGGLSDERIVRLNDADSSEHAFVGEGIPGHASKMSATAYDRRLSRARKDKTSIDVAVVCNDESMAAETDVAAVYEQSRDWLSIDSDIKEGLTESEMLDVLRGGYDFLHHIGHVDSRGIQCADGWLDLTDWTGVDAFDADLTAFFLNACQSAGQARALVDLTAIGGIATLSDIPSTIAADIGYQIGRLLTAGLPLAAALNIATDHNPMARDYMVVGDGNAVVIESKSGTPTLLDVAPDPDAEGRHTVAVHAYATHQCPLGALYRPFISDLDTMFLNNGFVDEFQLTKDELDEYLDRQTVPVAIDNDLYWSDGFGRDVVHKLN